MWTTLFSVLLLGLATNSKVKPTKLPIDRNSTTLSVNESTSMYPKTISPSDGDKLSYIDQKLDATIFQNNGSSYGGITWDKVVHFLNASTRSILQLENAVETIQTTNASDACKKGLERYFDSLSKWETWSVKMADASGKIAGGVLDGTVMFLGSYDECLKIRVESLTDGEEDFRGQYCLVDYSSPILNSIFLKNGSLNEQYLETYGQPPEWIEDFIARSGPYLKFMHLILGACVPSTCSEEDLKDIIMQITAPLDLKIIVAGCKVDKPMNWTHSFTSAVFALSAIAIVCTLGTVIDIVRRFTVTNDKLVESNSFFVRVANMFSVLSNTEMLLNRQRSESFACLDGIRFLSITWIVLSHAYDMLDTWIFIKYKNFLKIGDEFNGYVPLAVIDNAATALGSFFFISGFLLSYSLWKKQSKSEGKLNFFTFVFHKYWRLTPALALTITVFVVVAHLGTGPIWSTTIDPAMENCHNDWWKNFLYISNWWGSDKTCLMHTWYVGCLLQLHIVGFLLFHLIIRRPVIGTFVGLVLFFGCTALVAFLVIWNRLPLPTEFTQRDFDFSMLISDLLRFRPYYYIHSYIIGMLVGYLVIKYKDKKIKPRYQLLAWLLSIIGSLYAVYGVYGTGDRLEVVAFFYVFHFIAWSASLGWVTYACIAGYGGILNRFLSWKAFSLLSTVSYLVYLLHFIVVYYTIATLREPINYGHYEMICLFLSNLVISHFLAFVGHVAVEMPFTHLERMIF